MKLKVFFGTEIRYQFYQRLDGTVVVTNLDSLIYEGINCSLTGRDIELKIYTRL